MLNKIKARIKTIFLAGLLLIVPLGFTLFVLTFLFTKLDLLFTPFINKTLIYFGLPRYLDYHIPGVGFALALIVIFLVGLFTKNLFGRKLVRLGERLLDKIPVVRTLYAGAKQIIETVATDKTGAFRQVVIFEYPRKGVYCIGLITCESIGEIQEKTARDVVNVFIPTTPNPTSGYLLFVPKEEITYLDMSVEEGLKLVISGGILAPDGATREALKQIKE